MNLPGADNQDNGYWNRALNLTIRLVFIAAIVFWCSRIISPFFMLLMWSTIIAVTFYPLFLKLKDALGGRNGLAGTIFIVVTLAAVIIPTILLSESVIDGASALKHDLDTGTVTVPPPKESIKDWPIIGASTYAFWLQASNDLQAVAIKHTDKLKEIAGKLAGLVGSFTKSFLLTVVALIIAGILMMNAMGGGRIAYTIAERIAGEDGRELVTLSIMTIRSVVKGVVLVAMIQSLLAWAGMAFAHVPGAGFWALLVMMLAIAQLPPILLLGPVAIFVFTTDVSTTVAVIFLIWSILVSMSDGVLKPFLLGRGVPVPMLVVLIGAIGGMITAGVIGLFVGAVILSIGYKLLLAWLGDIGDDTTQLQADSPADQ